MLCEKCGKNNATVKYTQIINGQKSSLNICSECASQESIFDNFGSLLSFGAREGAPNTVCKCCGMTLAEFTRKGRMGCGQCYSVFRQHAGAMLRKIHGTQKHVGDTPIRQREEAPPEKSADKLTVLKDKLAEAIAQENFEEAAVLRDEIRKMENGERKE